MASWYVQNLAITQREEITSKQALCPGGHCGAVYNGEISRYQVFLRTLG